MSEETQSNLSNRMDRLEANLDQFIDVVLQNQRNQAVQLQIHQEQIASQQQQISEIRQLSQRLAETQIEMFARFDQMQSEIRGLRLETQRMLDAYLNPEPPDEDTGN
ncbi:hypothetical protein [Leptolyngbya sp. NIES-2104]|uniref:hypothetical protein n=1 Tax=Leptolyngbya sp. NIES-2104 TaxID=1552121 RepID=UPI0006EC8EF2|nr:hypothetical protein [Leptolyngbya sp. NIES-2104]GAP96315.1 hypothetical protein NIES2104_28500 [Leptolyngbya sp. NIES-2104]